MENKKDLQVALAFDEEKLEAINYFMAEKGVTIEGAMQDHLNEIYEKYVPSAMRKYLNRNDAPEQSSSLKTGQETAESQKNILAKKREERRLAKEQKQGNDVPLDTMPEEPGEESSQEMTVNM
ncbi:MAG: hypothetical protein EOM59_06455 [Clostridia bacterium]|nr:hypothetical protein [Clostridia bacterium]